MIQLIFAGTFSEATDEPIVNRNEQTELHIIPGWKKLNLESLELRRLRADLTLVYKILFGVIHTKS